MINILRKVKILIIFIVILTIHQTIIAKKIESKKIDNLISCINKPPFIKKFNDNNGTNINLKNKVLVARNVQYFIEKINDNNVPDPRFHIFAQENLTNKHPSANIICGEATIEDFQQSYYIHAPTIIEFSESLNKEKAIWQFSIHKSVNDLLVAINKPSLILTNNINYHDMLMKTNSSYKLFRVNNNSIELVLKHQKNGINHYLSIIYTVFSKETVEQL